MSIRELAEYLSRELIRNGFKVQRYDAYSTNSIYLKLDYGVCNSIRISDHPGKKYLKYRYNIGPFVTEFRKDKDKFDRYYYRADRAKKLISRILDDRKAKIDRYGLESYKGFMSENSVSNRGKSGFWSQAYEVNL